MRVIRSILRFIGHQDYLRLGVRSRIIRLFHDYDTAKHEEFVVPFFGYTYRGDFATYLDWSVYYFGAYASEELRLIRELLEPIHDPIVFDVGANVGHHTLYASRYSKTVFAFEPFVDVADKINVKIQDNLVSNVNLFDFGLGDRNIVQNYFPPISTNTGTGSFLAEEEGNASSSPLRLTLQKGDDFVDEVKITKLDLIKMDIQGFEPLALRGLEATLERLRPAVFFEWTQNAKQTDSFKNGSALFPHSYLFYQFIPHTPVLHLFRRPTYSLRSVHKQWQDGNVLAIPREYLERVQTCNPLPLIATRLTSDN